MSGSPTALELGILAAHEAWQVERKFSRYRDDSVTTWIHNHHGSELTVDEETASLLDFAEGGTAPAGVSLRV